MPVIAVDVDVLPFDSTALDLLAAVLAVAAVVADDAGDGDEDTEDEGQLP